jgi:RNA polymerase sigma-70 factor (ECF subfamily)
MSLAWHEIRDHLMHSSSTLGFQHSFDALRRAQPNLLPVRDPAALMDGLHCVGGDPARKNMVLSELVSAAQGDGPVSDCALTLLLLALWPGLDAVRRRSIARGLGSVDEITSDALARTTEAIRSLDLGRVNRIAATVLRNVERDMIRARKREEARERLGTGGDPDAVADQGVGGIGSAGYAQLAATIQKLLGKDAVLVTCVLVEGQSQAEAALNLGLSEVAARKRYQRAIKRLRDALQ